MATAMSMSMSMSLSSLSPLPFSPTRHFHPLSTSSFPLRSAVHRSRARFEKFGPSDDAPTAGDPPIPPQQLSPSAEDDEDSDLPLDLEDAVRQASRATSAFISSGGMRAITELLIPQFQFLDSEGAQAEMWGYSRIFLDSLIEETGIQRVKTIFPDAGAAALLSFQWKDASFKFSSLGDRRPVDKEDEIVVMILPDYQMLEYVEKIASSLSDDPPRPLIMWNPRLVSEDVGVGFNVRKLRKYFLSTFTTVYSMRPLPSGALFRCYPGMWKVFYNDKDRPGRYLLAREQPSRPDATELEIIFGGTSGNSDEEPSLLDQLGSAFSSLSRFMKVISR